MGDLEVVQTNTIERNMTSLVPASTGNMGLLEQALYLLSIGCNVVPSGKPGHDGKRKAPWIEWKNFQKTKTTLDQIRQWDAKFHPTLWGYITGEVSGQVVFDTDHPEVKALFDAAGLKPYKRTKRGFHYAFRWPGHPIKTSQGLIMPWLDVRGDGGFINAIGSNEDAEYEMLLWPTPENLYDLNQLPLTVKLAWQKLLEKGPQYKDHTENNGHRIPVGERNSKLCSLAGTLKNRGLSPNAIFDALKAAYLNDMETNPPITDDEIAAIVKQSDKWTISLSVEDRFHLTDLGNAERLIRLHGENFRWCEKQDTFFVWNGKYWAEGTYLVEELAKDVPKMIYAEASKTSDDIERKTVIAWGTASESRQKLSAMVELTKSDPRIHTFPEHYDTGLHLLNCHNGTVDLRTGGLQPHRHEDYITRMVNIDYLPGAKNEKWESFIKRVIPDDATREFVQQATGYSADGTQDEQLFIFCYGEGNNGKSTFIDTIKDILGPYAAECEPDIFMQRKYGRDSKSPDEEVGNLYKKRFVASTELEGNETMSVSILKRATGGEEFTRNMKYQRSFKYKPEFTVWMSGNDKPKIHDRTDSIWRRYREVPFVQTIPKEERIKGLGDLLVSQCGEAILAWVVSGAVKRVQAGGLAISEEIAIASEAYRKEQDEEWQFLNSERAFVDPDKKAMADCKLLHESYKAWWYENIEGSRKLLGKMKFNNRLKKMGFVMVSGTGNRNYWQGIGIISGEIEEKS